MAIVGTGLQPVRMLPWTGWKTGPHHGKCQSYGTRSIMQTYLTEAALEHILRTLPRLSIGVLGDLFLDRYLDIDAELTEPSIETGLDAYQVMSVRAYPGAAGTVLNNL